MTEGLNTEVTVSELGGLIATAVAVKRPVMIHGSPGVGKSMALLESASRTIGIMPNGEKDNRKPLSHLQRVVQRGDVHNPTQEFGFFDVRLTDCDPVDIGGLPYGDEVNDVQRRRVPDWFPSTDRTDLPDHGFLVLEEAPSAPRAVQTAAYQLTLDRRIGDKQMKPGWAVILTGNHLSDGGVVNKMPTPLCNRIIHLYVRSDFHSWTAWAIHAGVHEAVLGFLRFRPDLLNTFEQYLSEGAKGHAFATERSWHAVSDLMNEDEDVDVTLLSGTVGQGPAMEFNAFRKVYKEMPSIDGILMDPANAPVPENRSTVYAVCTALAARASRNTFGNVCEYIDRLDPEFRALTVKDAMKRHGGEVTSTPAFTKWATENQQLLG